MRGWREVVGGPRTWAWDLAFAAAVSLTIAFLGPFGSYARPLEERLAASFAFGLSGSVVFFPALRLAVSLAARAGFPWPFVLIAAPAAAAAPLLGVVALVRTLLQPDDPVTSPLRLYLDVLAIVLPFSIAYLLLRQRLDPAPAGPPALAEPRLYARLPASLGREVLALEAEDHYVRVHTARGSELLLMRFSDAVAELDGVEGERVHRSWWVARTAVTATRREGRRLQLTLANGLSAPVSREAVPRLRRAGWI